MENFNSFKSLKRKDQHEYISQYSLNFDFPLPSWEQVIYNINYCVLNNCEIKTFPNYGMILKEANIFQIEQFIECVKLENKNLNPNNFTSHIYISFSEKSGTFKKHNDPDDVWIFQCQGTTEWKIYENDKQFKYIMIPNDVLYIPRGMYHEPNPLSPRLSVSIGYEY